MHRLVANGIGGQTVQELTEKMSIDEFCQWRTYASFEPLPSDRIEYQISMLRYSLIAANSPKNKKPDIKKFVPSWRPKGLAGADEIKQKAEQMALAMGLDLDPESDGN